MKLVLEELAHQKEALNAIIKALDECRFNYHNDLFVNTELEKNKPEPFFIDVKMETGTGKTYVYTQTMFELHKRYGINKFIVLSPRLPLRKELRILLNLIILSGILPVFIITSV